MKLLDILKRDLKTWPKGAAFAVQDRSWGTTVKFAGHCAEEVKVALLGDKGVWQSHRWDFGTKGDFITELADDWDTARITEAAWEGEKAASASETYHARTVGELAYEICGFSGREEPTETQLKLARYLHDQGYRKFEIVEEDV